MSRYLLSAIFMSIVLNATEQAAPPVAKRVPKEMTIHGDRRIDNYFWLRDRSNPEVIQYLQAENAYTDAKMQGAEGLRDKLYQEILGRVKETDLSVPYRLYDYWY